MQTPSAEDIRGELERVLASAPFANSNRSQRFLRYVVESSLNNHGEIPKEFAIAVDVFGRNDSYDPTVDAAVRVEAGRLRSRLRDYYAGEGRNDPVIIEVPKGGYQARFSRRSFAVNNGAVGNELKTEPVTEPAIVAANRPVPLEKGADPKALGTHWKWLLPGAAIVLVCLVVAWYLHPGQPPLRVTEYHQLTHDGNFKYLAGADGSRISLILSGQRLAQMSLSGGEPVQIPLSFDPPPSYWDVSPDGANILFGTRDGGLWSFDLNGRTSRHLGQVDALDATWSPDGKRIAYSNYESQISVMRSDGTEVRLLYTSPSFTSDAAPDLLDWSPDGERIRFTQLHDLWEIAADGSNPHRVLPNWHPSSWKCCGRWTRDGSFFVFLAGETLMRSWGLGSQMWAIDERRGPFRPHDPFPLTSGPSRWGSPVPSRDGTKIFAESVVPRGRLERYDAQSKEMKPYLNGISAEFLTYSPDGKSIAYVTFPEGILWRANRDGTGLVQLTDPPRYPKRALWSPDGSRIIFLDSNVAGKQSIYMVSAQGGPVERAFPEDDGQEVEMSWSPDGRRIMFLRCGCKTNKWDGELRVEDIFTHKFTTIPDSGGVLWSVRWSPDGRFVEARRDGNSMVIYDFSNQKWTKIQDGPSDWQSWSHDGKFIYYFSWPKSVIYRVSVRGGPPEKIADLPDFKHTGWAGSWMGLDATDTPMLIRDTGTSDIYALTLERR